MEGISISSRRKLDSLQSSLLLDMAYYNTTYHGGFIEIDFKKYGSLPVFIDRFSSWFEKDLFLVMGDYYFKNHKHEEFWNCWKNDKRFQNAYMDEVYRATIKKEWLERIYRVAEDWDVAEFDVEVMHEMFEPVIKVRLELIELHFIEDIYENYILLHSHKEGDENKTVLPF